MLGQQIRDAFSALYAAIDRVIPDWLQWLWTQPPSVYAVFFIALYLAFTAAKQGWIGGIIGALALIMAFFMGRVI